MLVNEIIQNMSLCNMYEDILIKECKYHISVLYGKFRENNYNTKNLFDCYE